MKWTAFCVSANANANENPGTQNIYYLPPNQTFSGGDTKEGDGGCEGESEAQSRPLTPRWSVHSRQRERRSDPSAQETRIQKSGLQSLPAQ